MPALVDVPPDVYSAKAPIRARIRRCSAVSSVVLATTPTVSVRGARAYGGDSRFVAVCSSARYLCTVRWSIPRALAM